MAAAAIAALYLLLGWSLDAGSGLIRTVVSSASNGGTTNTRRVAAIDLEGVATAAPPGGSTGVTVTWQGAWNTPASDLYDLSVSSSGRSSWLIDGHPALEIAAGVTETTTRTVWLDAGFHSIDVTCDVPANDPRIAVGAAPAGHQPKALSVLRPTMPHHPRLRAWEDALRALLGWLTLIALAWAVRGTVASQIEIWRRRRDRVLGPRGRAIAGRALAWTILAIILAYGSLLRIDAITDRYGPVASPQWIASLQTRSFLKPNTIRPSSFLWSREPLYPHRDGVSTHYFSDPYIYLDVARHRASFYAAHFREPVFTFVTREFLRGFHDQDVAVSFASAFFSVLAVWMTYVLGAAVWSRLVGLVAALALSLDKDVIALASLGWRDDAYMAAVALCVYLMLRLWRAGQSPAGVTRLGRFQLDNGYLEASVLGVTAGFAIMTRLMAVSLLTFGVGYFILLARTSWRRKLTMAAIAAGLAIAVSAPYFINCWKVYGDPFYTFNVHGTFYSAAEGQTFHDSTSAYVAKKLTSQPLDTIDTVAQGMTTYPFGNKWHGLDAWHARAGEWAATAAIIGMIALASTAAGRLLLISMVGAMIPFSFTWKVDANFRFTEFTYPALLIAAGVTVDIAWRAVRFALVPRSRLQPSTHPPIHPSLHPRVWLGWVAVVAAGAMSMGFVLRVAPAWICRSALRSHETAMLTAGSRDGAFFTRGWSSVIHAGDVVSLRAATIDGVLSLPLPIVTDYTVSLRMDPFPRPLDSTPPRLPVVDVTLNGASLGAVEMHWTIDRVGSYEIVLPRADVRAGANALAFHVRRPADSPPGSVEPGLTDGDAISVWYLRVYAGVH